MSIFTARENFKSEYIAGYRRCESCLKSIHQCTALVNRWTNKKGPASLVLCGEECWVNYDHNYWLLRGAKREWKCGNERKAERLLRSMLPRVELTR